MTFVPANTAKTKKEEEEEKLPKQKEGGTGPGGQRSHA